MHDPVARAVHFIGKRQHRRHGFARETQVAVWIVLDDQETILHRETQQLQPALARERAPVGFAKVGTV